MVKNEEEQVIKENVYEKYKPMADSGTPGNLPPSEAVINARNYRSIELAITLFLVACLLMISLRASAQEDIRSGYLIQHYTDENGLPQNSVKAVARDKNGFVWLSTEAGLVRFDGHRFLTFNTSTLPISASRFGLFAPAMHSDYPKNKYEFCALTESNDYVGIRLDGQPVADTLFYQSYLRALPINAEKRRQNIPLASLPHLLDINPGREHYIAAMENQKFYIWKGGEIAYYDQKKRLAVTHGIFRDFFLIGSKPFATNASGGFIKIHMGSSPENIELDGDILMNPEFSRTRKSYRLFWNNISRKAFLYVNKCFYTLEESANGKLNTRLLVDQLDFDLLSIVSADYDENLGYLFLGSLSKGLFVISKKEFRTLKHNGKEVDNVYYAQIPVSRQSVLSAQGYELGLNNVSGKIVTREVSPLMSKFKRKFILAVRSDSTFWMGGGHRLILLDKSGIRVFHSLTVNASITSLYVDKGDMLWLGGEHDALYVLLKSGHSYVLRAVSRARFGAIRVIHEESEGTLLLGASTGLYRLHIKSNRLQRVKSFAGVAIRSFYTTKEGTWITTYGKGLYLFAGNRLIKFPLDKNQFLATAHCIVEDSKGFFWITTNKGLFQVSKRQLMTYVKNRNYPVYYLYRDKNYGFATNEFNGGCSPCAAKLDNGMFSLPSMEGLVWFSPHKIKTELPIKNIFVSRAELDGNLIEFKDELELSRNFELLRMHVATPYFGHANNIQMSYALSGGNRTPVWIPVPEDFVVSFPKMSSGKYQLTIRKVNGFGVNDYTYKRVKIFIPPTWYETWWFWCLVVVLVLFGLLFIFRLRTRYLVRKERDGNLMRHYRIISQIVAAVNHDIQTPLHYVTYSLRQINDHLHHENNGSPLMVRMSDESLNTAIQIGALTKNLLDYIKLQNKSEAARTEISPVNIFEVVSEISKLFAAIAKFRNVTINNEVEPSLIVMSDHNLVSIIIHNLLDNALKISRSWVSISAGIVNNRKHITIKDTGVGMPPDLPKWLNKSYKTYEDWVRASAIPEQKGIGLVIVKDLCALLHIELLVVSEEGNGTTVTLMFPPEA